MKNFKKAIALMASGVALTVFSTASFAGPVVTTWSYSTNAKFTGATFSGTTGTQTTSDYELSWGQTGGSFTQNQVDITDGERSALTIGNGSVNPVTFTGGGPATGSVDTVIGGGVPSGSEIGIGVNFSHWNNPIDSGFDTLTGGSILDTLTLTPVAPAAGPAISAPSLNFQFNFLETSNNGPCAGGTATPCGDLFGILAIPTLNLPFSYDGNDYLASILVTDEFGGAAPIGTLLDGECAAVSLANGCQGFRTAENARTTIQFGFAISTEPVFDVPEPSTLLLIGLGLAGLGRRRQRSKTAG
ncbi:MAG: THxN family PEP-CTERM protein [Gammaproteobacteria bacterium]|jgi:hypothetical protein